MNTVKSRPRNRPRTAELSSLGTSPLIIQFMKNASNRPVFRLTTRTFLAWLPETFIPFNGRSQKSNFKFRKNRKSKNLSSPFLTQRTPVTSLTELPKTRPIVLQLVVITMNPNETPPNPRSKRPSARTSHRTCLVPTRPTSKFRLATVET